MTNLLVLKEQLKKIYAKYGIYMEPVIKFLTAFLVLTVINNELGFDPRMSDPLVVAVLSAVCAVLPYGAIAIAAGVGAAGQAFAVSPVIAAVIVVIYIIMYCMAIRFTKGFTIVLAAVPVLYVLRIPYITPILLGMVGTPAAALPAGCGVILYYLFRAIQENAGAVTGVSIEDSIGIYKLIVDNAMADNQMLFSVVLFTVVLLVTYFIRKRTFNHAFEAGIAGGTVVCTLGLLIGKLGLDFPGDTLFLVLEGIGSGMLVFVISYFRMTLDYTAAEQLQFEDDDYYYYVKAVPKMRITAPEKNVKRINPQKVTGNTQNLQGLQENLRTPGRDRKYRQREYEMDFDTEIEIDMNKFRE